MKRGFRHEIAVAVAGICCAAATTLAQSPETRAPGPNLDSISIPSVSLDSSPPPSQLPDAPSAIAAKPSDVVAIAHNSFRQAGKDRECTPLRAIKVINYNPNQLDKVPPPCVELVDPYQHFLTTNVVIPLTWQQKGYLALHNWSDPFNLATIAGVSAINIAANSHTAYGPGINGWGELSGISLLQDATGEFFGAFAIPSLTHQDPRYYRMGNGTIPHRIFYAVSQTYVGNRDGGGRMPNYGILLTYPIAVEISNLYVPGIATDSRSTTDRILAGLAFEPVNNLVSEFVPDVARRIHVRIIFVQKILNNLATTTSQP